MFGILADRHDNSGRKLLTRTNMFIGIDELTALRFVTADPVRPSDIDRR
jgi:hypothetical protein